MILTKTGDRVRITSGSPWEPEASYCRALRSGNRIWVAGTTASDENGDVASPGDPYNQARQALEKIACAIELGGASMRDVVRTRMFVTDISQWREYARAHKEFFADWPPAATMVEVKALIDPRLMIEIEVDAEVNL